MGAKPFAEMFVGECRQRAPPVDAGGLFQQPFEHRVREAPVGQRGRGGRDRVQAEDLAQKEVAQGARPVLVPLIKHLGLELGHVDLRRAFGLASLALQAEVECFVKGFIIETVVLPR